MKKLKLCLVPLVMFFIGIGGAQAADYKIAVDVEHYDTDAKLAGAVLKLTSADGTYTKTFTSTGHDEFTVQNPGKYTVSEVSPVSGFIASQKTLTMDVNDASYPTEFLLSYQPLKANITLKDNEGNPLVGMKFEIIDENGKKFGPYVANTNVTEVAELPFGTYTVHILDLPVGWEQTPSKFVIDETCIKPKDVEVPVIKDPKPTPTPEPGKPTPTPTPDVPCEGDDCETITEVPNTLSQTSLIIYGLGAIVTAAGAFVMYRHAKEN